MTLRPWHRVALAMFSVGWGANQFSPLLVAYRDQLGMSAQTRAFLFGIYAVGLVPGLLLGGSASDRWGRRGVVVPFVALSPVATLLLILWRDSEQGLAVARLLAGVCSGVVFSAASAWVADLSADDAEGTGARRATISLSAGFGAGPLVAGLIAQWSSHPLWVPYLPHLVLGSVALVVCLGVPGADRRPTTNTSLLRIPDVVRSRRFVLAVAPVAPWVFGSAAISIAFLPGEISGPQTGALAFAGVLTGVTLGTGVLVQPLARRLDDERALRAGQLGLVLAVIAILLGVLTLTTENWWVLLCAGPVFGAGYGCCLVSGLRETERLSPPEERGATVAFFYALTYLGFAAPYVLGALAGLGMGARAALALAAAAGLSCLAVVSRAVRGPLSSGDGRGTVRQVECEPTTDGS